MIELKHITKLYGSFKALDDINLTIKDGEIYGIVGQSGAGKSTLIRCINMLEPPTSGEVLIDGKDMTKLTKTQLREERKKIGMIFQHFNLLSNRTVAGNVAFPLELSNVPKAEQKKRIDEILDVVGLTEYKNKYPSQLSGGQKQRVGIARAIVSNPSVLLSDEATSALDPETVKSILQLLKDINKKLGITIIFTNPQTETLKKFVGSVMSSDVPEQLSHMNISKEKTKDNDQTVVSLKFRGDVANEPIIANLIKKYNLDVSILYGSIDYIQNVSFGRLIIMINGSEEDMNKALGHLKSLPITSEVIGYVSSNN